MSKHLKNEIIKIINEFDSKIKLTSCALRYLENIVKNLCDKYFKLKNKKQNNYQIINKIFKKDMLQNSVNIIKNKEKLFNDNNNQYIYNLTWINIKKDMDSVLGKRKRFNDKYNFKSIKKKILEDIDEIITKKVYNNAIYKYDLKKNNYKFKDWLQVNYSKKNNKELSILSSLIQYTCYEIIDISINNESEKQLTKNKIINSIGKDEELLFFIDNLK